MRLRWGPPSVLVSYWMNRLQGFEHADDLVVTLNPDGRVDPARVIARDDLRPPGLHP